jgi:hypothetical protein
MPIHTTLSADRPKSAKPPLRGPRRRTAMPTSKNDDIFTEEEAAIQQMLDDCTALVNKLYQAVHTGEFPLEIYCEMTARELNALQFKRKSASSFEGWKMSLYNARQRAISKALARQLELISELIRIKVSREKLALRAHKQQPGTENELAQAIIKLTAEAKQRQAETMSPAVATPQRRRIIRKAAATAMDTSSATKPTESQARDDEDVLNDMAPVSPTIKTTHGHGRPIFLSRRTPVNTPADE